MKGTWIHGLVGSGTVLAVNRWSTGPDGSMLPKAGLDIITAGGLRRTISGPDAILVQSADSGRVAVLRSSGIINESFFYSPSEVAIYTAAGKLLTTIKPIGIDLVNPRLPEIVLSGNYVAVLTVRPRLELYDWRTGALLHSWRVPRGAGLLDVYGQIAAYLVTRANRSPTLRVHQLQTGRDIVLAVFKQPAITSVPGLQIDRPGLVYAVNEFNAQAGGYGRLTFVPMARVLAAVSKGHVR